MDAGQLEGRKTRARAWFEALRDDICADLEAIEDALPAAAPLGRRAAGPLCAYTLEPHRSFGRRPAAVA